MADPFLTLILEALTRSAAEPAGLPLFGGKSKVTAASCRREERRQDADATGLFVSNAVGKRAAQQAKDEGLLSVVRTESKGKSTQEICAITEKGLQSLFEQASPRQVLESFVQALDTHQQKMNVLIDETRTNQEHLRSYLARAEMVLEHIENPRPICVPAVEKNGMHERDGKAEILRHLAQRQEAGALDDCPLPELYARAGATKSGLTFGQFHDLLRQLLDERKVYLHPWTGPLYELPEPACALLVGHEIAYYASLRQ